MALTARGTVYVGNVRFTTDPQDYAPLLWAKRATVLQGIGGSVTIQDFGMVAQDNRIRLASGQHGYLEQSVVAALHALYRAQGSTYPLTDWTGNEFTVWIESFEPRPTFIGTLYTYEMSLVVTAITKLLGSTFA